MMWSFTCYFSLTVYKMSQCIDTNTLKYIEVKDHSTLTINMVIAQDVWKAFRVHPLIIYFFREFWKEILLNQNGNHKLGLGPITRA